MLDIGGYSGAIRDDVEEKHGQGICASLGNCAEQKK
jgi:hypothetical protein